MGSRRRSGVTRQEFRSGEFETLNRIPAQRDITDTEQACKTIKIPDDRHGHDYDFEVSTRVRSVSAIRTLQADRDHTPWPARVRTDVG
jgi:hypothetical protein